MQCKLVSHYTIGDSTVKIALRNRQKTASSVQSVMSVYLQR